MYNIIKYAKKASDNLEASIKIVDLYIRKLNCYNLEQDIRKSERWEEMDKLIIRQRSIDLLIKDFSKKFN